jgi:hypothetical protein
MKEEISLLNEEVNWRDGDGDGNDDNVCLKPPTAPTTTTNDANS